MTPTETILLFMEKINQRSPEKLSELMTNDHVFTDSLGHAIRGREKMLQAWRSYFELCPDYWVSQEELFEDGEKVAVFGSAGGTIRDHGNLPPENKWRISAAWFVVVAGSRLKEWRVYADNKPVYDILARRTSA